MELVEDRDALQLGGDIDGAPMDGPGAIEAAAALLDMRGSRGTGVSSFPLDSHLHNDRRGFSYVS